MAERDEEEKITDATEDDTDGMPPLEDDTHDDWLLPLQDEEDYNLEGDCAEGDEDDTEKICLLCDEVITPEHSATPYHHFLVWMDANRYEEYPKFQEAIRKMGGWSRLETRKHGFLRSVWTLYHAKYLCEFEEIHPVLKQHRLWADLSSQHNMIVPGWHRGGHTPPEVQTHLNGRSVKAARKRRRIE